MSNKGRYKRWEVFILLLSFIFFFTAISAYFTGFSFQKSFFGLSFDESQNPIGKLIKKNGIVQRELNDNSGFEPIDNQTTLYNYDTIFTNNEGTGIIQLNDGGSIELTPNTMIRLTLENHLDQAGLYRAYHVEVFNGKVSAKAKDTKFILNDRDKTVLVSNGEDKEIVTKIEHPNYSIKNYTKPNNHGDYTIQGSNINPAFPDDKQAPIAKPTPSPKPSPVPLPVIAPKPIAKPLPKVIKPRIKPLPVYTPVPKPTPVPTPTPTPSGSPVAPQKSEHEPDWFIEIPLVKSPANYSVYSKKQIDSTTEKRILLTWSRKKHLAGFVIQISKDQSFKTVMIQETLSINFYSFINPPIGVYWWRIKSFADDQQSGYTKPYMFSVKP